MRSASSASAEPPVGRPGLRQCCVFLPRPREVVLQPPPALPRLVDPPAQRLALGLGPCPRLSESRKALLDRLDLGPRFFSRRAGRSLGRGIALGRAGEPVSDLVDARLRRFRILGERLFALDIGSDLDSLARVLLAGARKALLLLGQPLMLDTQPMQGSRPLGLLLTPLG